MRRAPSAADTLLQPYVYGIADNVQLSSAVIIRDIFTKNRLLHSRSHARLIITFHQ